ncbi:MAG: RNA methyltransferase [Dermatophilaceae bacterium]|nr:RNA methyltransferase [Dermatophilaceae bacterium]
MPIEISDPGDERVRDYFTLTDVLLRSRLEPERGLYLAESEKVIRRALAAGHRPRSFLMGQRWVTDLSDLVETAESQGVPVYVAPAGVIEAMTGFHLHRGALASMHRPLLVPPEELLQDALRGKASRVVVLEDIVDHTNMGAVFRSCAALGVDAVLITPRCADPLYRRSVRVSMGTVFQVPWTRIDPWPAGIQVLRDHGFTVAAFALGDGAISLDELATDQPDRLAIVFGTEGDGLSRLAVKGADVVVKIPMAGGVDSLNIASASAVGIWALRPPRRLSAGG